MLPFKVKTGALILLQDLMSERLEISREIPRGRVDEAVFLHKYFRGALGCGCGQIIIIESICSKSPFRRQVIRVGDKIAGFVIGQADSRHFSAILAVVDKSVVPQGNIAAVADKDAVSPVIGSCIGLNDGIIAFAQANAVAVIGHGNVASNQGAETAAVGHDAAANIAQSQVLTNDGVINPPGNNNPVGMTGINHVVSGNEQAPGIIVGVNVVDHIVVISVTDNDSVRGQPAVKTEEIVFEVIANQPAGRQGAGM